MGTLEGKQELARRAGGRGVNDGAMCEYEGTNVCCACGHVCNHVYEHLCVLDWVVCTCEHQGEWPQRKAGTCQTVKEMHLQVVSSHRRLGSQVGFKGERGGQLRLFPSKGPLRIYPVSPVLLPHSRTPRGSPFSPLPSASPPHSPHSGAPSQISQAHSQPAEPTGQVSAWSRALG